MTKVLVVEYQPSVAAIVRYHFEHAGWTGIFAGDAESGWRMVMTECPDAAVVDIGLPGANGWTLVEKIRADARFHSLPLVVLTGHHDGDHSARAKDLGCEFMAKPFAASALLSMIQLMVKSPQPDPPVAGRAPPENGRVDLVSVGVVLLLNGYRIEGQVFLPPELSRFSDAWESVMRDQRTFVPLTDATVTTNAGATIASPPFVQVRKTELCAVYPIDGLLQ